MKWAEEIRKKTFLLFFAILTIFLFNTGCGCDNEKDKTPPDTIILSSPPNPAGSTTATFEFKCDENDCVYECQIDSQGWNACESPQTYTGLSKSEHVFEVRAYDMSGNVDDTPASYAWSIITAVQVSDGDSHACAVLSDGRVKCWGKNDYGQLGDGTKRDSLVPVFVLGIESAVCVSAGWRHTCAVLSDGSARCWGRNNSGQLGDGTQIDSTIPVMVSGLDNVMSVSTGGEHTCALLKDRTARCWGLNITGQVGIGESNLYYTTPVQVTGLTGIISITAGGLHTCAVVSDGRAYCWGDNFWGELGNGTNNVSFVPVEVTGITGALMISAQSYHTCALMSEGTIKCWGENTNGELGNGNNVDSNLPVVVTGINNAISASAGENVSCAILSDFTVNCWGTRIANGTEVSLNTPVRIAGLNNVISVDSGHNFNCAIISDYSVKCWGFNSDGVLGDGTTDDSKVPVSVINIP